jgi:hypothetical protein
MVNVWPAMLSEPLCPLVLTLGLTANDTVPLPLPLFPDEIRKNPEELFALQPQPAGAVTSTLPLPPAAPKEALGADNKYVHCGAITVMVSFAVLAPAELLAVKV